MAESYRDAAVFDCQVKAHKTFFEDELPHDFKPLPEENTPPSTKTFKGKVYDITGFYGQRVVALLSQIVNNKEQFTMNKTFYFLIRNSSEDTSQAKFELLFRLTAGPTEHQPGSGIVVLRPKGKVRFTEQAKKYDALNGALKAHYETNTTSFAKDIKELLKDNAQNKDIPEATFEAYMILLFEIARRLVKSENPVSDKKPCKKEEFDVLPIGSAIAGVIKLLALGKYYFEDVFLPGAKFHCFSRTPEVRRTAIEKINEATMNIDNPEATGIGVRIHITKEEMEQIETTCQLQELRKLFCPDEQLAQRYENLTAGTGHEKSGGFSQKHRRPRLLSSSNAERTTALDHLEQGLSPAKSHDSILDISLT